MAPDLRSPIMAARTSWRRLTGLFGIKYLWLIIWLAGLAAALFPGPGWLAAGLLLWASAFMLAGFKAYGRRMLRGALFFMFFWGLALTMLGDGTRPYALLNLAVWLGLGLNLMFIGTPLALALAFGDMIKPLAGPRRAGQAALVLALMMRLLTRLFENAATIRQTVKLRGAGLKLTEKMALWGRALIRLTFNETDELARAMYKKWPDFL